MRLIKMYLNFLKWVFSGSAIINIILSVFANTLTGDVTTKIANWLSKGIIRFPTLPADAGELYKFFYILGLVLLYIIFISGMIFLLASIGIILYAHKYNLTLLSRRPELIANRQMAAAVRLTGKPDIPTQQKHETIQDMMIEFEKGVQALFGLKQDDYRCYWVMDVPPELQKKYKLNSGNIMYFSSQLGQKNSDRACIDHEIALNRSEHFGKNKVEDYVDIHEYAWISNLDTSDVPLVGICFMIKKSGVLTNETEQLFRVAASHILVVEQVDSLNKNMVEFLIERETKG